MNRRRFLNAVSTMIHAGIALCALIPGVGFLFDPTRKKRTERGFTRVARFDDIANNQPHRAVVRADRWDAYVHHPPGAIGAVWLVRDRDQAKDEASGVRCLQTICPHLGCSIETTPQSDGFICRCHTSGFTESGALKFGPAPRDMDELACRVTEPDESGTRWVEIEYREFKTGTPNPEPIT